MWMHPAFHGSRGSFCHVTPRQTVWQWSVSGCRTTPFLEKLERRAGEEGVGGHKEEKEEALAICNRAQTAILREV